MITMISGKSARTCSRMARPSAPGILRSVSRMSTDSFLRMVRASAPSAAASVWYPARVRARLRPSRVRASSSATRMTGPTSTPVAWSGEREADRERCPPSDPGLTGHASAVCLDDSPDDGQPEPEAVRLRADEGEKDQLLLRLGDARPAIRDRDLHPLAVLADLHAENAAVGHRLKSVLRQVEEDLAKLIPISRHGGR